MDVRFVNPFVAAVRQVFKTMAGVEVQVLKPRLKTDDTSDVSGIIGFSGDAAGAILLCFPQDVACKLASAFAGEEMTIEHPDFEDAIGELANMVAGSAKAEFQDLCVNISLPSVAVGEHHAVHVSALGPETSRLVIPCQTDRGSFHVEVAMAASKKEGNQDSQVRHGGPQERRHEDHVGR